MSLYVKLIALVALLAALIASLWGFQHAGVSQGRAEVQAKWDKEKREQAEADKAALFTRIKNNERIAEQQALNDERIRNENKVEIAAIRAAYARPAGLRLPASGCSGSAAGVEAESASGGNAAFARTVALPPAIERDLQELMQEADIVVANCRATQSFIRVNRLIDF